jgi:hypothetical protein
MDNKLVEKIQEDLKSDAKWFSKSVIQSLPLGTVTLKAFKALPITVPAELMAEHKAGKVDGILKFLSEKLKKPVYKFKVMGTNEKGEGIIQPLELDEVE